MIDKVIREPECVAVNNLHNRLKKSNYQVIKPLIVQSYRCYVKFLEILVFNKIIALFCSIN
ncbi:MAG: hypothetical protein COW65_18865 [Cytophagales bacterium CG18_big_fil_WC_8_21_14_2_50_42_9]|nr:MAG: hypothetical protein COW65_18865 [Cytophagales bacterium CG18_big_fil_WC_8_21_14_2_50_42_9]